MGIELMHCLPDILPAKLKARALEEGKSGRSQSVDEDIYRRTSESAADDGEEEDSAEEKTDSPEVNFWSDWSVEDLRRLVDFQHQIFQLNFLVYFAYKMIIAHSMEVFKVYCLIELK